ncbi:MAG: hypothetical protein EU530_12005 [Promethearchaeota archaeon]|nr:MAG: hypothetical protein EU530_12005 [Candidatus Lokiarchaeota archaeon]
MVHFFIVLCGLKNDFIEGTSRTRGGKTIIAIPSTTSDEKKSHLVPIISRKEIFALIREFMKINIDVSFLNRPFFYTVWKFVSLTRI